MNPKLHKALVNVSTDPEGRHFMTVAKAEHVTVNISAIGEITVNVNDSCVFILNSPDNIYVSNQLPNVLR